MMSRLGGVLATIMVVALGLGVPVACMYFTVERGFSSMLSTIIALASIGSALTIGFFAVIEGALSPSTGEDVEARRRLDLLRASHRAMLEELDEIVSLLREIRDVLRGVEAERH